MRLKDEYTRYVIMLTLSKKEKATREIFQSHVQYLKKLENSGQLVLAGPFTNFEGGMVVIKAASYDEAKRVAESDPVVKEGVENYEIRIWELSCKENNHMGLG